MLIKSADNKSSRLKLLEDLKQQPLNKQQGEWLEKELWALRTGIQGEKDAAYYINAEYKDSDHYAILHDLRIEVEGETAQIDHLLIGHYFAFLFETKNFNGNIDINERGEFTVKYANGKKVGIPSPIEQSYRHERLLLKLFERLDVKSFMGKPLEIHHVVLMSPKAIISRPDSAKFDTANVIKADSLRSWKKKFLDKEASFLQIASLTVKMFLLKPQVLFNQPNAETIRGYGKRVAHSHKPANLLALPDFMQPRPQAENVPQPAVSKQPKMPPGCATCGEAVSPAEVRFCRIYKERFDGQLYCREHQQAFPNIRKQDQENVPAPAEQAAMCCAEPGCDKVLSAAVIAYCTQHAEKFNGKFYCMVHQRRKKSRLSESQT